MENASEVDKLEELKALTLLTEDEQENLNNIFNIGTGLEGIQYQLVENQRAHAALHEDFDSYLTKLSQKASNWANQLV